MMHAIQVNLPGPATALERVTIDEPRPGPGEVLLDIHAAGLNFIDTYHRSGLYPMPRPFIPGLEGSGVVRELGEGVTGFAVGDHVAWIAGGGGYAEATCVAAEALLNVPPDMNLDTAAALPLQGMTAHYLVTDTYPLGPGDRCLIHAAAGGTGRLLVQMAKLSGAKAIATVGSEAKAELARSAGADHVINYVTTDLVTAVESIVGPDGIDVVYDGVGAATLAAGLGLLRRRGTMVTFGNASGPVPPLPPLALMPKSLYLTRPKLNDYIVTTEERNNRWDELCDWVRDGRLDVRIGAVFALADAALAHEALESRATTGKILLVPGDGR